MPKSKKNIEEKSETKMNINWYSTNYLNTSGKYWKINIFWEI